MNTTHWPIIGHDVAVRQLTRAVDTGAVAHAYLFSGPDQVGKRTLARTLTQALLCPSIGARPCGSCRACRLVEANRHSDFLTLDLAWQAMNLPDKANAQSITVDAVRQMNSDLARRPHEGQWKVLLIPNVEELTVAASNAFLKTLEEPPSFVVILLTTRDPELVLPTIRSRCQPIPLFALPVSEVEQALRVRWGVGEESARLLARLSGGRLGWAVRAAQDERLMQARSAALSTLQQALNANRAERLLLAAPLGKENDGGVMRLWGSWWRDVLLLQSGADEALTNIDQQEALKRAATRYQPAQVRAFLRDLQRLLRVANETNANPPLLWEVLLLKLPHG